MRRCPTATRESWDSSRQAAADGEAIDELEAETTALAGMVIEREREIRGLAERLQEANECHDRSIASLDAVSARLEEIQARPAARRPGSG